MDLGKLSRSRTAWFSISLLFVPLAVAGCSDGSDEGHASSRMPIGRAVLGLESGMSVGVVKNELGEPDDEVAGSGEVVLRYGSWRLIFDGQGLREKVRSHPPMPGGRSGSDKAFDVKVLELHLGMSLSEVKSKLGAPGTFEDVFERGSGPERILRYGPWELRFRDGKLKMRVMQ